MEMPTAAALVSTSCLKFISKKNWLPIYGSQFKNSYVKKILISANNRFSSDHFVTNIYMDLGTQW